MAKDLTTLETGSGGLGELTADELGELLAEPAATIGFFDLLGGGRKGAVVVLAVVTTRFNLTGIDDQKFDLVGTDNQKFPLIGTDNQKFDLVGA